MKGKTSNDLFLYIPLWVFTLVAVGCVFMESRFFVDEKVFPKWICFFGGMPVFVFSYFCLYKHKKNVKEILRKNIPFILSVICILQAVCGIYGNVLHNSVNCSVEMGSFDNVAGFVSCVCGGFPFVLYICDSKKKWNIYNIGLLLILYSIFLSYSRTAYIAIIIVFLYSFATRKLNACNKKKVFFVCFLFACFFIYYWGAFTLDFKKYSAIGRILIWRVAITMFLDKPFCGFGINGVEKYYMSYQARYLTENPNPSYIYVSDNVNRLFNEYLTILVDFGIVGFVLLLSLVVCLVKNCYNSDIRLKKASIAVLVGIATMSFFSYPLSYPFTWLLICICICFLSDSKRICHLLMNVYKSAFMYKMFLLIILFLVAFYYYIFCSRVNAEFLWNQMYRKRLETNASLKVDRYYELMPDLKFSPYFLYNFAYELFLDKKYSPSQEIANICKEYWSDYDLEMLMALNDYNLGRKYYALTHLGVAAKMCPNKYAPIYYTYVIYRDDGNKKMASTYANKLFYKSVKINNINISVMKQDVYNFLKITKEKSEERKSKEVKE